MPHVDDTDFNFVPLETPPGQPRTYAGRLADGSWLLLIGQNAGRCAVVVPPDALSERSKARYEQRVSLQCPPVTASSSHS